MVKDTDLFVRTHVVFYFVSLLLSDVLQGVFSSLFGFQLDVAKL